MKFRWFALMAVGVVLSAGMLNRVLSQEEEKKKDAPPAGMPQMSAEDMAKMQKWMATMNPGEHHKHLEHFVGEWEWVMKMWMSGPEGPAMETKGTSSIRWILGKRYIQEEFKGQMMGMPYEGIGLTGYDNYKNLYVSSWASNMDTQYITQMGSRNPKTGVFTFYGTMDEPALDVRGRTVKYVTRIVDKDHHVFSVYDLHAGDDYRVFEVSYTRKK